MKSNKLVFLFTFLLIPAFLNGLEVQYFKEEEEKIEKISVVTNKNGETQEFNVKTATIKERDKIFKLKTKEFKRLYMRDDFVRIIEEVAALLENGISSKNVKVIYDFIKAADIKVRDEYDKDLWAAMHKLVRAARNNDGITPPKSSEDAFEPYGYSLEELMKKSFVTLKKRNRYNFRCIEVRYGAFDDKFGDNKNSNGYYRNKGVIGTEHYGVQTPLELFYYTFASKKKKVYKKSSKIEISNYLKDRRKKLKSSRVLKSKALTIKIKAEIKWAKKVESKIEERRNGIGGGKSAKKVKG